MAHCCVQILKPKQSVSLPIRSVHIKPSLVKTDPTDVLLGLPRGKPRNPVNRKLTTHRHAPQLAPENLPHTASDSSLPDRLLGPRVAQTALSSTDLLGLRIWWSYDVTCSHTRCLGICLATTHWYTPSRVEEFMLMSLGDVITPS